MGSLSPTWKDLARDEKSRENLPRSTQICLKYYFFNELKIQVLILKFVTYSEPLGAIKET